MGNSFSAAEITEIGVQIEKNGYEFYAGAAARAEDADIRDVFAFLAEEEQKHIGAFRGLLAGSGGAEADGEYTEEYFAYLRALGDEHIFTRRNAGADALRTVSGDIEAVNLALGFEKDSILLFTEFLHAVAPGARELVNELIRQERMHFRKLAELKDALVKKKSIMNR